MKIYRVSYFDRTDGNRQVWCATKAAAREVYQLCLEDPDRSAVEIDLVSFPDTETSIVEWLNKHCYSGND